MQNCPVGKELMDWIDRTMRKTLFFSTKQTSPPFLHTVYQNNKSCDLPPCFEYLYLNTFTLLWLGVCALLQPAVA